MTTNPPGTPNPSRIAYPAEPAPGPVGSAPNPRPASGDGVLVPIDAWQRILSQPGNLHDAGRQPARARDRAARAETEATFARERVAELRQSTAGRAVDQVVMSIRRAWRNRRHR